MSSKNEMDKSDEVERTWLEEAHRRVERLERGETELLSLEKVNALVRALLHRGTLDYSGKLQRAQIDSPD